MSRRKGDRRIKFMVTQHDRRTGIDARSGIKDRRADQTTSEWYENDDLDRPIVIAKYIERRKGSQLMSNHNADAGKKVLKPCPFCGGEADSENLQGFECVFHDTSCAGAGDCPIEGLRGWNVDVWNNRPIELELHGMIDERDDVIANMGESIDALQARVKILEQYINAIYEDYDANDVEGCNSLIIAAKAYLTQGDSDE